MLQRGYNSAITPQDVYNLKSKIARMDGNNSAAKNVAMRDADAAAAAVAVPQSGQPPTDPALEMQGEVGGVRGARKCACQCCDHGIGDVELQPAIG